MTGAFISYSILNLLTKFGYTQDSRYSIPWINNKRDQIRANLIQAEFRKFGFVNPVWQQDVNLVQFTPVTESDIDYGICGSCPVSKAYLPPHIHLFNPDAQNEDNGIKLISPCGTNQFYQYSLDLLKQLPDGHPRKKFNYYWEIGEQYFVNKKLDQLRALIVCQRPSDVNTINNTIVQSGNLIINTSYRVIKYQITHNGLGYNPGQTFVAVNTTYTGQGAVILTNSVLAFDEATSNYPCTADMARIIELEMLTKEFNIEKEQVSQFKNDYGETNNQVTNKAAQI